MRTAICIFEKGLQSGESPPGSPLCIQIFLFIVHLHFCVNTINVSACCCHTSLNLHVFDAQDSKTRMLIVPTNLPACSLTAVPQHREPLINYSPQPPTGAAAD